MNADPSVEVSDNRDAGRFEVHVDGQPAGGAYYEQRGGSVVFTHTEVDDAFEGRGVGSALARTALDTVRSRGQRLVPLCPFIAGYIDKHDEYADLVDRDLLRQLRR